MRNDRAGPRDWRGERRAEKLDAVHLGRRHSRKKVEQHMSNKLFIGGLSWDTDDASLRSAFEPHGEIQEATVVTDRDTGRSRGFGFVTYVNRNDATKAIEAMNGADLDGRTLRVDAAQDKQRGGGGGGGGGGRRY